MWSLEGELAVNCNCDVFCPCVVSLGRARPTQGYCQGWLAVRVDAGSFGETDLGGLRIMQLLDIPGRMTEGGWTVGLYVDERADDAQAAALEQIFCGTAGGSSGLLKLLVAHYLGMQRVPITYDVDGSTRRVAAGKEIVGAIEPVEGASVDEPVTIENTPYWVASRVVLARATRSKLRDFGRVWNLDGKSAEICAIRWSGP